MIKLRSKETGEGLGVLTEAQLKFLIDQLEEEFVNDKDYYLDQDTLEYLQAHGADPALMEILRYALGNQAGVEIRWSRSNP